MLHMRLLERHPAEYIDFDLGILEQLQGSSSDHHQYSLGLAIHQKSGDIHLRTFTPSP